MVITGLGVVTPLGNDLSSTWNALRNRGSAIGPVTRFDARECDQKYATEVKEFDPRVYFRISKALKLGTTKRALRSPQRQWRLRMLD